MQKVWIHICLATIFFVNGLALPSAQADQFVLPKPGAMVQLSPAFNPPVLKGIKVFPEAPTKFEFIISHANVSKEETTRLIKYFLASLTVPEDDLWVNLSPYENNRIVPESFGQTEMGRDLLAQDYILKQVTASLIYPEDEVGKKFWQRIYQEAAQKFGSTDIPVNTFNKVWIIPEKAVVYENAQTATAYVVEASLKVMLEEDYLALDKNMATPLKASGASQVIREVILPELEREVNQGKNFAHLRQVYNSYVLAAWYKKKIKNSILNKVYSDRNKVAGVQISDLQEKEKIYQQYLQAFKKGVYNYVKEEIDPVAQKAKVRKYFSGGTKLSDETMVVTSERQILDRAMTESESGSAVSVELEDSSDYYPSQSSQPLPARTESNVVPLFDQDRPAPRLPLSDPRIIDRISYELREILSSQELNPSLAEANLRVLPIEASEATNNKAGVQIYLEDPVSGNKIARLRLMSDGEAIQISSLYFRDSSNPDDEVLIIQPDLNGNYFMADTIADFRALDRFLKELLGESIRIEVLTSNLESYREPLLQLLGEERYNEVVNFKTVNVLGERLVSQKEYKAVIDELSEIEPEAWVQERQLLKRRYMKDAMLNLTQWNSSLVVLANALVGRKRGQIREAVAELKKKWASEAAPNYMLDLVQAFTALPSVYSPSQKFSSSAETVQLVSEFAWAVKRLARNTKRTRLEAEIAFPDGIQNLILYEQLTGTWRVDERFSGGIPYEELTKKDQKKKDFFDRQAKEFKEVLTRLKNFVNTVWTLTRAAGGEHHLLPVYQNVEDITEVKVEIEHPWDNSALVNRRARRNNALQARYKKEVEVMNAVEARAQTLSQERNMIIDHARVYAFTEAIQSAQENDKNLELDLKINRNRVLMAIEQKYVSPQDLHQLIREAKNVGNAVLAARLTLKQLQSKIRAAVRTDFSEHHAAVQILTRALSEAKKASDEELMKVLSNALKEAKALLMPVILSRAGDARVSLIQMLGQEIIEASDAGNTELAGVLQDIRDQKRAYKNAQGEEEVVDKDAELIFDIYNRARRAQVSFTQMLDSDYKNAEAKGDSKLADVLSRMAGDIINLGDGKYHRVTSDWMRKNAFWALFAIPEVAQLAQKDEEKETVFIAYERLLSEAGVKSRLEDISLWHARIEILSKGIAEAEARNDQELIVYLTPLANRARSELVNEINATAKEEGLTFLEQLSQEIIVAGIQGNDYLGKVLQQLLAETQNIIQGGVVNLNNTTYGLFQLQNQILLQDDSETPSWKEQLNAYQKIFDQVNAEYKNTGTFYNNRNHAIAMIVGLTLGIVQARTEEKEHIASFLNEKRREALKIYREKWPSMQDMTSFEVLYEVLGGEIKEAEKQNNKDLVLVLSKERLDAVENGISHALSYLNWEMAERLVGLLPDALVEVEDPQRELADKGNFEYGLQRFAQFWKGSYRLEQQPKVAGDRTKTAHKELEPLEWLDSVKFMVTKDGQQVGQVMLWDGRGEEENALWVGGLELYDPSGPQAAAPFTFYLDYWPDENQTNESIDKTKTLVNEVMAEKGWPLLTDSDDLKEWGIVTANLTDDQIRNFLRAQDSFSSENIREGFKKVKRLLFPSQRFAPSEESALTNENFIFFMQMKSLLIKYAIANGYSKIKAKVSMPDSQQNLRLYRLLGFTLDEKDAFVEETLEKTKKGSLAAMRDATWENLWETRSKGIKSRLVNLSLDLKASVQKEVAKQKAKKASADVLVRAVEIMKRQPSEVSLAAFQDTASTSDRTGGIDLKAKRLDLNVRTNSNRGIDFVMDDAMLKRMERIQGFEPKILEMRKIPNVKAYILNPAPI